MLKIVQSSEYQRDYARLKKTGYDLSVLNAEVQRLARSDEEPLEPEYVRAFNVHELEADYEGYSDLHLDDSADDWVLVFKLTDTELKLARTGTHEEVFPSPKRNYWKPW